MKLSEFNTNEAADVLCEITPLLANIVTDDALIAQIGTAIKTDGMSKTGMYMEICRRISAATPVLMKTHREDVFGLLAVLNGKSTKEIGAQPLMETMGQIKDALQDKELITFFGSLAPQGRIE